MIFHAEGIEVPLLVLHGIWTCRYTSVRTLDLQVGRGAAGGAAARAHLHAGHLRLVDVGVADQHVGQRLQQHRPRYDRLVVLPAALRHAAPRPRPARSPRPPRRQPAVHVAAPLTCMLLPPRCSDDAGAQIHDLVLTVKKAPTSKKQWLHDRYPQGWLHRSSMHWSQRRDEHAAPRKLSVLGRRGLAPKKEGGGGGGGTLGD